MKLAICIPWTTEMGWTRSWKSIARLGFFKHPDDCELELFGGPELGDGWCSARRHNACMEQAIIWGADLILILGADQKYLDQDMLCRLVQRYRDGYEVVAARVPIRGHVAHQFTKPFQSICWRAKPDENGNMMIRPGMQAEDFQVVGPEHGEMVRINGCGSGVLMFPADALKKIKPPWFYEEAVSPTFARKACADWPFVNRLQKEARCEIWCDTTIRVTHIHPFEIDETFSERFSDWAEGKGDPTICEIEDPDKNTIKQARVSPSLPFYDEKFRKRYGFAPYSSPFTPAVFFGCYTAEDLKAIQEHVATAVLVWAGTDALNMRKALEAKGKHPFGPNVHHVAISSFIADDLRALGLPFRELPLCNVDESLFKPVPRGKAVYTLIPEHDRIKYGGAVVEAVKVLMPDVTFINMSGHNSTPPSGMPGVYAHCGIGLRLLEHDGLSNTAIELGLMGRRVVWNGNTPNAIQWKTIDDVVTAIRLELDGPDDSDRVAADMRKFLEIDPAWKTVDFYKPAPLRMQTMTPELAAEPYDYQKYFDYRYEQGPRGAGGPDPSSDEAKWTQQRVRELLAEHDCKSVTEVGCGACVRWDELPSEDYFGIDVSPTALEHAEKKFPDAVFCIADVSECSAVKPADAVLCLDVLQHIKPEDFDGVMDRLLAAARKVLIIKVSVDIPENHYQFNHIWPLTWPGTEMSWMKVPGSQYGRLFIFVKEPAHVPV